MLCQNLSETLPSSDEAYIIQINITVTVKSEAIVQDKVIGTSRKVIFL